MAQHMLTTRRDADTLEARDTNAHPLLLSVSGTALVGDYVVLTSSDGAVFLGEIVDTYDDYTDSDVKTRAYVTLT